MRASISASLMPLFAKSDLSPSSDNKCEARTIERCNARKMKNCSGLLPLTLATPHFLLGMTNLDACNKAPAAPIWGGCRPAPHWWLPFGVYPSAVSLPAEHTKNHRVMT
jgi:hypothetical protein